MITFGSGLGFRIYTYEACYVERMLYAFTKKKKKNGLRSACANYAG